MDGSNLLAVKTEYGMLIGFLKNCPQGDFRPADLMPEVNASVNKMKQPDPDTNWDRFLISSRTYYTRGSPVVEVRIFRAKLSGFISQIHARYFSGDPSPFAEGPLTIVQQNQHQEQSTQISIQITDIKTRLEEKLSIAENDLEKSFLQKAITMLGAAKDLTSVLTGILNAGIGLGLSVVQIKQLLGL